ncbi:unnamed protein product [Psylliodes chrysocephalus]|uniref:Uncharacterized protein n=1 Tax=Psylliodes chrysocephalus TaxID=3402493 RepID=A0A9P0CZR6_9CUCU|nr:unnamed protein product [Psylliodes chrysocephala]
MGFLATSPNASWRHNCEEIGNPSCKSARDNSRPRAVAIYLVKCSQQIEHIVELVGEHRDKAEKTVEAIMKEMEAIGMELDVEIRVPRLTTKQSFRINPPVSTPEQYFKISVLIPYLDSFCNSLKEGAFQREARTGLRTTESCNFLEQQ